jgi:hypothetical protein
MSQKGAISGAGMGVVYEQFPCTIGLYETNTGK